MVNTDYNCERGNHDKALIVAGRAGRRVAGMGIAVGHFAGFCSAVFCFICFTSAPAFVTSGLAYAPTDDEGRVRLRLAAHCFPCRRIIRAMAAPAAAASLTMPACMFCCPSSARGAKTAPSVSRYRHIVEIADH